MPNTLGVYNPIFYAQEALVQLENVMGLANRVYMGYDEERRSFGRGETINIRRPSSFVAQNAPSSAQDVNTDTVPVTLAYWKEVKFALTDKELAFTRERIIQDHIRPAAVALADVIDQTLAAHYIDIPWQYDVGTTPGVVDITTPRQILFDNKVPLNDPNMMHYMMDGSLENAFLQLSAFSQQQGAADRGVTTQFNGNLGTKFGFNLWANQNTPTHTAGTGTITTPAVNNVAGYAAGTSTLNIDAAAITTGTLKKGDSLKFSGHAQAYVLTADPTFTANAGSIAISPPLKAAVVDNEAITFIRNTGKQGLAFHRNALCLVTAPLSEMGNGRGAEIASIQDPITGLSLRSRIYYDGDNSKVNVALDVLFGTKVLDPNMAVRVNI
jgi:hypothetical protein